MVHHMMKVDKSYDKFSFTATATGKMPLVSSTTSRYEGFSECFNKAFKLGLELLIRGRGVEASRIRTCQLPKARARC